MRDFLLAALVLGLVPFILRRAWVGALAWTWIGIMSPQVYLWNLRWVPFAQIIGIAFLIGWVLSKEKRGVPWTPEIVMLLIFLVFLIAKTPLAWNPEPAFLYLTQFIKIIGAAILISTVIHTPKHVRALFWVIIASLGFFGFKGGVFTVLTGGDFRVQGPEGTFLDGNTFLGVALIMGLPLLTAFANDAPKRSWKLAAHVGVVLTIVSIVFTYSRGALLGLGAVSVPMLLRAKRKLLISIALVPVLAIGVAFTPQALFDRAATIQTYEEDNSAKERLSAWSVAKNIALRHPLGAGFILDATPFELWRTYSDYDSPLWHRAAAAHSNYFQVLGEHGFFGLAMWLFILGGTFITLYRARRLAAGKPEHRWISEYAGALQIGLIGYAVAGAFVSLAYFDLFYLYVILAGILLREARTAEKVVAAKDVARRPVAAAMK